MRLNRRVLLITAGTLVLSACTDNLPDPAPTDTTSPAETSEPGDDMPSGELATREPEHVLDPDARIFVADGRLGAVGHGELIFWDTSSGKIVSRISADLPQMAAVWAFNGQRVASANGTSITVNDAEGQTMHSLSTQSHPTRLSLSPDSAHLAVAGSGAGVTIWSLQDETPVQVAVTDEPAGARIEAHYLDDGRLLVASSTDQCPPQIWSADGRQQEWEASMEDKYYHLKRAGERFTLIVDDEQEYFLEVRAAADFSLLDRLPLDFRPRATAMHPGGTHIAVLAGGGTSAQRVIHLIDLDSGQASQLVGNEHPVIAVVFSEDGTAVLSSNPIQGVFGFEVSTNELVQNFELPG